MRYIVAAIALAISMFSVAAETNDLPRVSVERLLSDEVYDAPVRLEALVTDAFPDEVDPRFVYFTLDFNGLTNEDIAYKLGISAPVVRDYLKAVMDKIGAANRAEAVAIAMRKHLLKV